MRTIDRALVEEVWRDIIAYPPDRVEAEARAFLQRQPHVATFARTVMQGFDEAVQGAAIGLAFLVVKIAEASREEPLASLSEEHLLRASQASGERHAEGWGFDAAAGGAGDAHLGLARHIMAVFYGGDPNAGGYDDGVKATLAGLLTTLTEALDLGEAEA
jgi:hypothetical protein